MLRGNDSPGRDTCPFTQLARQSRLLGVFSKWSRITDNKRPIEPGIQKPGLQGLMGELGTHFRELSFSTAGATIRHGYEEVKCRIFFLPFSPAHCVARQDAQTLPRYVVVC